MTTIGSIGTSSSNSILQYLQAIAEEKAAQVSSNGTQESGDSEESSGVSTGNSESSIESLKTQMDQAITDALQKLDSSASATEIMQAVKEAVDDTMEANGIDPEAMQKPAPGEGNPPSGETAGAGSPPPPPDGADRQGSDTMATRLDQLLEENGFDPDQIRAELQAEYADRTNQDSSQSSFLMFLQQFMGTSGFDVEA